VSIIETPARVTVKEALPALGMLTAFLFAWGLMQLLDRFCRALFGTAEGLVGWIPFAGRLAKQSIHKIEQKVSNYIGGAERGIDNHIATSYHKLATIVRSIPSALIDDAGLLFGLAAALVVLPSVSLVKYLIRVATMPIHAAERELDRLLDAARKGLLGLGHFVKGNIWARVVALALLLSEIAHELPHLRAREKALERDIAKLRDWVKHRKLSLLTGAFLGAFVWALGKLDLRWIRCSKVRKLGNAICHMPTGLFNALLGGVFGVFLFSELCRVIVLVSDVAATVLPKLVSVLAQAEVALCGGRYSATPAMTLNTTTLPTVDNPITF